MGALLSRATKVHDGLRFADFEGSRQEALGVFVGASDDPRHGGKMLDCDEILYEGLRIKWVCRYCEEYWIGRTGVI